MRERGILMNFCGCSSQILLPPRVAFIVSKSILGVYLSVVNSRTRMPHGDVERIVAGANHRVTPPWSLVGLGWKSGSSCWPKDYPPRIVTRAKHGLRRKMTLIVPGVSWCILESKRVHRVSKVSEVGHRYIRTSNSMFKDGISKLGMMDFYLAFAWVPRCVKFPNMFSLVAWTTLGVRSVIAVVLCSSQSLVATTLYIPSVHQKQIRTFSHRNVVNQSILLYIFLLSSLKIWTFFLSRMGHYAVSNSCHAAAVLLFHAMVTLKRYRALRFPWSI